MAKRETTNQAVEMQGPLDDLPSAAPRSARYPLRRTTYKSRQTLSREGG